MRDVVLFEEADHRFILLNESEPGEEEGIRSNQYLVSREGGGVLLDPGGFGVMPGVLSELLHHHDPEHIQAIVLSHQDPDIVGGLSTWLELTPATIYAAHIWLRFLPHYGLQDMDRFRGVPDAGMTVEPVPDLTLELTPATVYAAHIWLRFLPHYGLQDMDRFRGVPDAGMTVEPVPDLTLELIPAHFLHSVGQLNAFDPRSGVLFSGDVGAGLMPEGEADPFVRDLTDHLPHIEAFHRRYMASNRAARLWADRVAGLGVTMIAPQHGPVYAGAAVEQFLDWMRGLQCGVDLMNPDGSFSGAPV
jgi:flavorubredoxin